jgi:hypothetical protein
MPTVDTSSSRPGWGVGFESQAGAKWLFEILGEKDASVRSEKHLTWVDYSMYWLQYAGVFQVPKGIVVNDRIKSWTGYQQHYSNVSSNPEFIILNDSGLSVQTDPAFERTLRLSGPRPTPTPIVIPSISPTPTPIVIPSISPTPAPLVFGVSPLIEQGQTNIELISGQEQLLEVPTDQFDAVSATFRQSSGVHVDFGVRVGMPWSGTEIEIKFHDTLANEGTILVVTRRHKQLGAIYWQRNFNVAPSYNYKIEFQEESDELTLKLNGVDYSLSNVQEIDFDFETFENVTLFINSENTVINTAESPYFSVTNFYVHNNENVLIP